MDILIPLYPQNSKGLNSSLNSKILSLGEDVSIAKSQSTGVRSGGGRGAMIPLTSAMSIYHPTLQNIKKPYDNTNPTDFSNPALQKKRTTKLIPLTTFTTKLTVVKHVQFTLFHFSNRIIRLISLIF